MPQYLHLVTILVYIELDLYQKSVLHKYQVQNRFILIKLENYNLIFFFKYAVYVICKQDEKEEISK